MGWPVVGSLPSEACGAPYHAMPMRPRDPAVTQGMTLLPSSGGETVNGPDHVFAPSVETASLTTPGPFSVPFLSVGYSAQVTYTLPAASMAIDGNRLPVRYEPLGRGCDSFQLRLICLGSLGSTCVGSVQSSATCAAVVSPALPLQ